jgi:hypothetical protein
MIIEVSRASPQAAVVVSGLDPVMLTHPVGQSFVNQPDGAFYRGFASGSARCQGCRQRDGEAALQPKFDADALAAYDRAATELVDAFLANLADVKASDITVGRRYLSTDQPPAPRPRGLFARPAPPPPPRINYEYERRHGYVVYVRRKLHPANGRSRTAVKNVWVWCDGHVSISDDAWPIHTLSQGTRDPRVGALRQMDLSAPEGFESVENRVQYMRRAASHRSGLPFWVFSDEPIVGLAQTPSEMDATLEWFDGTLRAFKS